MKTLTSTDPAKATELLQQAPQLSYAIFQALLLMGLVSTEALSSVVEAAAGQPAPIPPLQQGYAGPPIGSYPPGYPPPPPHMSGQLGMQMATPPVQGHGAYAPPPPQHRAPIAQQPAPQALPDSDALMQQVLAMPQELIDSLPPADRAQLMALRASYGR
jgi:cleavage stimulation factor subunit 2